MISLIFQLDFKYFEDTTDETHDPMGTLFPLWKFPSSVPNRSVTALTWNPTHPDMLIIGYGLCKQNKKISFSSQLKHTI